MTLEVLGVDDCFGGVVCLGVCLVYLWCPWGFGINASGRLRGLWGLCSSVGEEFLVLSQFVVPWARYGYGVRLVLYLAYCCFLVPALRLCFSRLCSHVWVGVSALRIVVFHVVGLSLSCCRLFGIPHSVLVVLGQKPPGVPQSLPIFPCFLRNPGCSPCLLG